MRRCDARRFRLPLVVAFSLGAVGWFTSLAAQDDELPLRVRLSWGHELKEAQSFSVKVVAGAPCVRVENWASFQLETGEQRTNGSWTTEAGAGDVDGIEFTLVCPAGEPKKVDNIHILWSDHMAQSDAATARRLWQDPALYDNPRLLTVQMSPEGDRGFSVTAGQLLEQRSLWIPSLHTFITAGEPFESASAHLETLRRKTNERVLDEIRGQPEANYDRFASLWKDMGDPRYTHPQSRGPGRIVGLTWDSAIPKFGIDRGGGVWNDYGNPDHFRFWFSFGDLEQGIHDTWRGQRLQEGLPVLTTTFEQDGLRYELEQFAYPLRGPPPVRRGDIAMVLLQKLRLVNLTERSRRVSVAMAHRREFPRYPASRFQVEQQEATALIRESAYERVLFSIEGVDEPVSWSGVRDYQREQKRMDVAVFVDLPANQSREFVVKLPSQPVGSADVETLQRLDYGVARTTTLEFWSQYLDRGAVFSVPERIVNQLYRASLWHALRLPRRHGGSEKDVRIDLPYSNFAYSQEGIPWPINQAVYVDYMLYDLRGYHDLSQEELLQMFLRTQKSDGSIAGWANWLVYTPGMLYAVAKHYLLSDDRQSFEQLLPSTLESLDWCLREIRGASDRPYPATGLVHGALNDGTGEGTWAFNQAYLYAGLDLLGRALERYGHERAGESRQAARSLYGSIQAGFGAAAMRSPLVPLRDDTWSPYVPAEVLTRGRLLDQWYATDIDTGAAHLVRLGAVPPGGLLADALLHDHEDNLFWKHRGIANEPVYNQQAMAYLLRDDPEAVIRAFYSYMASAFSHSVLEPVEHRWSHGQYFGPPSTDGAWFEVLRYMLIHEQDDGTLLLGQAVPRRWLEDGKRIEIRRAPTYYGPVSMTLTSQAASGQIRADIEMPRRGRPEALVVRLRHPHKKRLRSVTVNGVPRDEVNADKEWVRIADPTEDHYEVVARY